MHQVALSWRGGETGMEGPGVVEERAEEEEGGLQLLCNILNFKQLESVR